MRHIHVGADVMIGAYSWLWAFPATDCDKPKMVIGDGCKIGHFNHIACVNSVELGPKVLTADRVYISDHGHAFEDASVPIMDQPIVFRGSVAIGEGTWLGENVSVLSCRIGRNCVVGTNAVVTKDIPDFCVAAGVPARVIRRFNQNSRRWDRV